MSLDINSSKATLYIIAILILCILAASFVSIITFIRPDQDNTALITMVLGIITPVILALLAGSQHENHLAMNSRLTELLNLTAKSSKAEGKLDNRLERE